MYKVIQEGLYPDTTYGFDSGGDPDVIPSLTYEQLKEFHRLFYSPTNARFFLYGDISTEHHLAFLKEMLSGFDRVQVASFIKTQPRWEKPSKTHGYYPIGKEENLRGKTAINVAWMMAENTDYETVLLLQIVSEALVGSAAGPLRKALIDAGLGEDLSPVTGLEMDLKQLAFAVGLRGSDPDKAERIETLTLETLKKVAESGFDRELIEGALHQVEFHGKEIVRSVIPYAIILMGRVYYTWLYDGDPLIGLNFSRIIEAIRKKWAHNARLFQEIVQKWFFDNPHRLLSVMEPSRRYSEKRESSLRKKMVDLRASLSRKELEGIRSEAVLLRRKQIEADTPEAIATLPKLRLADIPRMIEIIPTVKTTIADIPAMEHEIFANGIAYLDLAFDVSDIPEDLQPYLPLLGKLTTGMGAAGLDYEEMAKRIVLKTGGLGYSLATGMSIDAKSNWQKMIFSVKVLHRNAVDAVKIVADILADGDLSDEGRMRDLIAESKNALHSMIVPSGHTFARRTAAAALSVPAYRDEQWGGRTQLRFLSRISEQFKTQAKELCEKLILLRDTIFRRQRLMLNLTADSEGLSLLSEATNELINRLEKGGNPGPPSIPELRPVHTGVTIPAQVCYVAKVIPAPIYSEPLSASLLVLARELGSGYLYKRIRVQGGAYGGMSLYDSMHGNFSFLSYRDPNLVETLKAYNDAIDFVSQNKIEREALEKTIIGTIGSLDKPMDPRSKGYTAMIRDLAGLTDEDRQKFRNQVLESSPESLMEAANRYLKHGAESQAIAVYAAAERLSQANKVLDTKLDIEPLV
jgi:Zn-dependent M16 (insulinase) family peptidase